MQRCTLEILSTEAFSDVGVFYSALGGPRLMGQLSALCSSAHKAFDSPLEETHTCAYLHTHAYKHIYLAELSEATHILIHSVLLLALDFSLGFLETSLSCFSSTGLYKLAVYKGIVPIQIELKSKYIFFFW